MHRLGAKAGPVTVAPCLVLNPKAERDACVFEGSGVGPVGAGPGVRPGPSVLPEYLAAHFGGAASAPFLPRLGVAARRQRPLSFVRSPEIPRDAIPSLVGRTGA